MISCHITIITYTSIDNLQITQMVSLYHYLISVFSLMQHLKLMIFNFFLKFLIFQKLFKITLHWNNGYVFQFFIFILIGGMSNLGFPGDKECACLGLGRSPGEGNGYPLQYSCLENPMERGNWWATVHGVANIWT